MIIDVHAHYVPIALLDRLCAERRLFPSVEVLGEPGKVQLGFRGGKPTRPISPRLSEVGLRNGWLEKNGIEHQVVGGWLDMFGYELPADEAEDWCRFLNGEMRAAAEGIKTFAPLACVPLQSGARAARVLEEALGQGFHGAMIGTQPKGAGGTLDDPDLDSFWEAASAHKATIFVHPMFICGEDRLNDYDLVNAVGRLSDTSIAVSRLLFSGHLTRFPGVNLVISHGGGALSLALGRLRRNHEIHPGKYADPLAAFQRLYFDSILFDPRALRFLCDVAGADKVMLGSDQPFPIGDADPLKVVNEAPLAMAERQAILGETAARLFRIEGCSCGHSHGKTAE